MIRAALKEWSVAVDALTAGETILLLRKGGIREDNGQFSAQADKVALFPTFEHQQRALLKPKYQSAVEPVTPGWHPQTVELKAWAEITHIFLTRQIDQVATIEPFHIWQPQLAEERLKWKPNQPLYVLTLRAYRFSSPVVIPWQSAYGGCRSWISLEQSLDTDGGVAAISEAEYLAQVAVIQSLLTI